MSDIILKRPSETKAHEVCFGHGDHVLKAAYYDCPLVYGDDETINETLAHLVNLACDYRERAEKAERELAKKGERLQNSERRRKATLEQLRLMQNAQTQLWLRHRAQALEIREALAEIQRLGKSAEKAKAEIARLNSLLEGPF